MPRTIAVRRWATPLTIGSSLLMAGTGILMFFEWERGLMTVVHQWFSWFFVFGAAAHIVVNIRPLKNHLKSPAGRVSVVAFAAILIVSAFSWGMITGPQLERPIEQALVDAPLAALAGVTRTDPDALISRLGAEGITADRKQTITQLASTSGVDENRLLAIVFMID